jgi:hypothetical protein
MAKRGGRKARSMVANAMVLLARRVEDGNARSTCAGEDQIAATSTVLLWASPSSSKGLQDPCLSVKRETVLGLDGGKRRKTRPQT